MDEIVMDYRRLATLIQADADGGHDVTQWADTIRRVPMKAKQLKELLEKFPDLGKFLQQHYNDLHNAEVDQQRIKRAQNKQAREEAAARAEEEKLRAEVELRNAPFQKLEALFERTGELLINAYEAAKKVTETAQDAGNARIAAKDAEDQYRQAVNRLQTLQVACAEAVSYQESVGNELEQVKVELLSAYKVVHMEPLVLADGFSELTPSQTDEVLLGLMMEELGQRFDMIFDQVQTGWNLDERLQTVSDEGQQPIPAGQLSFEGQLITPDQEVLDQSAQEPTPESVETAPQPEVPEEPIILSETGLGLASADTPVVPEASEVPDWLRVVEEPADNVPPEILEDFANMDVASADPAGIPVSQPDGVVDEAPVRPSRWALLKKAFEEGANG